MASNHGVVYLGPGKVAIQSIDYPELKTPQGRKIDHGVIIEPVTTNICGSDQHMVRGRTTAPRGLVLGHEITGEVIECGSGVESTRATSSRCHSTSRADGAATARSAAPTSASM
jgi:glutathione-independent formaldehyde dehydrogenase